MYTSKTDSVFNDRQDPPRGDGGNMKNEQRIEMYGEMLRLLRERLAKADGVFMEMSQKIVGGMAGKRFAVNLAELEELDRRYCALLAGVIEDLPAVYRGRIRMFPVPGNAGLIEKLEQRNAQAEELETIVDHLLGIAGDPEEPGRETAKEAASRVRRPNILVAGGAGVGKTSLIQAVTRRGVVPDCAIGSRAAAGGSQVYETKIANFIDAEGMIPGRRSGGDANLLPGEMPGADQRIHNIWYCIDGSGARLHDSDRWIIQTLGDRGLLVVTKSELMCKEQTRALMKTLLGLIDREKLVFVSAENKTGLARLIAKTREMSARKLAGAEEELAAFRQRWDDYYAEMRENWRATISGEADNCISWAAGRAAAIALMPLPLADIAPLIANEIYMICKLAGVYGIAADDTMITMLLGCAGGSIAGKIDASILPFLKVPIAAGITYGVGRAAKAYFESGMAMDSSELRKKFLEGEREAGKRDWKKAAEA